VNPWHRHSAENVLGAALHAHVSIVVLVACIHAVAAHSSVAVHFLHSVQFV
jgi:hypothetical protein